MILHFTIQAQGAPPVRVPRKYHYTNFGLPIASETMYDFIRERIGARPASWPGFDASIVRKDAGADAALLRQWPGAPGRQRPGGARSPGCSQGNQLHRYAAKAGAGFRLALSRG